MKYKITEKVPEHILWVIRWSSSQPFLSSARTNSRSHNLLSEAAVHMGICLDPPQLAMHISAACVSSPVTTCQWAWLRLGRHYPEKLSWDWSDWLGFLAVYTARQASSTNRPIKKYVLFSWSSENKTKQNLVCFKNRRLDWGFLFAGRSWAAEPADPCNGCLKPGWQEALWPLPQSRSLWLQFLFSWFPSV